ncbi:glutathione S-transferase family protein [Paucibacter sp. M5-1]|uniref:glutathione S-transferase family protein n=1 Tax=Paucibacter sp. M5-1 TaxID=3015998 RepID=UPI0010F9E791|nr:glutathione S-transferase family protein [Paucibacter sp. M5-1]MCZ7881431.1 glutathione S-transferase family protein [Paucibacter sp. M5-1]
MTAITPPLRLYRLAASGHCHRVELMLSLLGLPYEVVHVDLLAGEQRRPEFLALNPLGQVPVLVDGDLVLSDSNAILLYLVLRYAPDSHWLPSGPVGTARLQRWFSLAASWLDGVAGARFAGLVGRPVEERSLVQGRHLFAFMEAELQNRDWLLDGAAPSLADISLYSYSSQAGLGGLALDPYPRIRAWLARVEALPGFIALPDRL